jgi:hypothetical protein
MSTTMNDERNENLHGNLHGAEKCDKSGVSADPSIRITRFLRRRKIPDHRVHDDEPLTLHVVIALHRFGGERK